MATGVSCLILKIVNCKSEMKEPRHLGCCETEISFVQLRDLSGHQRIHLQLLVCGL
jgi:hypothetical protein